MAYESFLFIKPSKNKTILLCRYADQIEIVDTKSRRTKIVCGPEGFEPKLAVMNGNDGKKLSTRGSKTRYAFITGKVTNQFIYLLYSGNKDNTNHRFYGASIFVYDWNGKPVSIFH